MTEKKTKKAQAQAPGSGEVTVSEVTQSRGLFASRMASETITIRGTTFTIEALPKSVKRWAMSKFDRASRSILEQTDFVVEIASLGITSVVNLTGSDGEPITIQWDTIPIDNKQRRKLSAHICAGLPDELLGLLAARIMEMDRLTDEELDKLDFTKP